MARRAASETYTDQRRQAGSVPGRTSAQESHSPLCRRDGGPPGPSAPGK